jgi:hypothetical protein
MDRRLGGPQSHSGHGGEEKNSQPPPKMKTYLVSLLWKGRKFSNIHS